VALALFAIVHTGCVASSTAPSAGGDAVRAAQSEPARDAQARAKLEVGRAAIARGEMAAAAVALREALRLRPDLTDARWSLGIALYNVGDLDGAIAELRALLQQRPEAVRARFVLATALMAKQEWPWARAELEEVTRRQPDLTEAHYSLGLVRYTLADRDGAIEAYRRVIAESPGHADARYHLALMLKLAQRDTEAFPELLVAARAGHARAQYFLGTAYARGLGAERNLGLAILWWSRAGEQAVPEAGAALGALREVALGRGRRPPAERAAVERAFQDYRAMLWDEFPDVPRGAPDEPLGAALLRGGRGREAVAALVREASALSEPAQALLETLYHHGVEGQVRAHDGQILDYFKAAADEGQARPRIALARFYAAGLGVPKDMARAIALLKATPHEDAQRLLQELSAAGEVVPAPTRP
jgi:TPR repeat protein